LYFAVFGFMKKPPVEIGRRLKVKG